MATVTQFWAPHEGQDSLFQAVGTAEWSWALGDNSFYWGFAIRPRDAVSQVEVVREWTTSDNDQNQVEHFVVTISTPVGREFSHGHNGDLHSLQFTAIKVQA
jgi:hypothetical protein